MSKRAHGSDATRPCVLVVGGSAAVRLAWCRLLGGRGLRVWLLRWERQPSAADASRFCHRSIWLGSVDDGVAAWRQAFEVLLRDGGVTDVLPVDALGLALVCDGRTTMPQDVTLLGPGRPAIWANGADRLSLHQMARAAGWAVLPWIHVAQIDAALPVAMPLVVRPRWDVRLVNDEPARFSTKRVANQDALDAKLRDDVPRGEVLLQAASNGQTTRICIVARSGQVLGCWRWPLPLQPDGADSLWQAAVQALVARLDWTGLLELEVVLGAGGPLLVDTRFGGHDGFASLMRGDAEVSRPTQSIPGGDVLAVIAGSTLGRTGGPDRLPRLVSDALALRTLGAKLALRLRASLVTVSRAGRQPGRLMPTQAILVVCKGNINRSIVAEQLLQSAGFTRTVSAGLLGLAGRRPSRPAEAFLAETLGIRPGTLQSRSLRQATQAAGPFDVVLCFERRHVVEMADRCPDLRGHIQLVSAFAPDLGGPTDISDPHGGSEQAYRACFQRIHATLKTAIGAGPEGSTDVAMHATR
jgi:protein-tyrosine-phosphatase